jgi:predicted ATPase/class 3 adenylate cyclase
MRVAKHVFLAGKSFWFAFSFRMPLKSGAARKRKRPIALPSGNVIFVFTDIEGSTQRWEAHHQAMQAAVERHEDLVRGAIETNDGYIFKTAGDSFCAAFARVSDAVAATIAAQVALASEDFSAVSGLRVRMGVHAGSASERGGDYFGPEVNRAARLMSIGHGGQVLLSGAARELLSNVVPSNTSLIDLGLRRLRDLTQPEHVWQLAISGLPIEFPPLNSLDARSNNLPIQLTLLLGREQDLEAIESLTSRHRLLTVCGAGGVGKTRLALQVAADVIDRHADGVWFADLAPISSPELVASVVAKAIGMPQAEGRRVEEDLPQWLKRKQLLLVLDNCEHLIDAVAILAASILTAAPGVRILATSRQALGIAGEQVYRLPSLALPAVTVESTAANALNYGAIALFVDRATASDSRFTISDDNASIVAEICRRLDGIPLAIELAAARVKVLSIPNLAQRLDDRFRILTGGSRTALPRQKTLVALIDWSYGLLTPQEQILFNRVSVFAGGFSLNATTVVCAGAGIGEDEILDLLALLAEKSLVAAETGGKQERYRLLESTRAFGLDKLEAAGERERLSRRHAEYFRDQALGADESFGLGSVFSWLDEVGLELDNYRTALEWALAAGRDVALAGAMAGALVRFWSNGGLSVEGRSWIDRALATLDESAHARVAASLWNASALLSDGKRRYEAATRACTLYESVGDARGFGWALMLLADSHYQMGHLDEAGAGYKRALATMRESGDRRGTAWCLNQLAYFLCSRGDAAEGRVLFAQALEAFKVLGSETGTAQALGMLAEAEFKDGRAAEALRLVEESLELYQRSKNAKHLAMHYNNSAAYRVALGDIDAARIAAGEGLQWALRAQSGLQIAVALQHLALVASLRGHATLAATLAGFVAIKYQELLYEREPTERWSYEKLMATLRAQLSESEIEESQHEGASWMEDRAVEAALTA